MGRKYTRRRRSRLNADEREGLAWLLFLLGPVVYTKLVAVDWHWWVVLGVFAATTGLLMVRAFARAARQRQCERLMVDDVRRLPWRDFESYVQVLLQDLGWQHVEVTGGAGDGGVDLRGIYNGEPWIVQCKHRKSDRQPLPPSIARDVLGTLSREGKRGATRALLVTTGRFGPGSRQIERDDGIELWDGTELARQRQHADQLRAGTVHHGRWATWGWLGGFVMANAACVLWAVTAQGGHVQLVAASAAVPTLRVDARPVAGARTQPAPVPTARPARVTCGTGVVRGVDALAIRAAPGPAARQVGEVARGGIVALGCESAANVEGRAWRKVRSGNVEGWMTTRFLTVHETSR